MYTREGTLTIGPILFADDNLNPLSIESANDLQPMINLYNQYKMLSGHRTEQNQKEYKKILGTTPTSVLLHRALLIYTDLIPIYIHVFIALPVHRESMKDYIKKYWISL